MIVRDENKNGAVRSIATAESLFPRRFSALLLLLLPLEFLTIRAFGTVIRNDNRRSRLKDSLLP
jgi:hypothetical protein